jgi:ketosteroid isomerase-like protein
MNSAFAEAFNSNDIEKLVMLYEPNAILAPIPGKRANGLVEIKSSHEKLLALGGTLEAENLYCMEAGNIALLRGAWRLSGVGSDGMPFEFSGHSAEVVRKQPDGSWLYAIDHAHASD